MLEHLANAEGEPLGVHVDLLEQQARVEVHGARLHVLGVDARGGVRAEERPLHGQDDVEVDAVDLGGEGRVDVGARRRHVVADRERAGLDAPQDVHDAAVLRPHLVVEEAAQVLGEDTDGGLGLLAGVEPVVVDAAHAAVWPARGARPDDRADRVE